MSGGNREKALEFDGLCAELCSLFKKKVKSICAMVERIQKYGQEYSYVFELLLRKQQINVPCKYDFKHATATNLVFITYICWFKVQVLSADKIGFMEE